MIVKFTLQSNSDKTWGRGAAFASFLALSTGLLSGCAIKSRVALCPSIALLSYPPESRPPSALVNKFLEDATVKEHVKINVLSPTTADLIGWKSRVRRLTGPDYKVRLCAFYKPSLSNDYPGLYMTCMDNADQWASTVNSASPDNLLLVQTHYADVCVASH
jgi:hypothetical protein